MKKTIFSIIIAVAGLILISVAALSSPDSENKPEVKPEIESDVKPEAKPEVQPEVKPIQCKGTADCIRGEVDRIVDGDTIKVEGFTIRLSLTNTPETYEDGFRQATVFTESLCPVGSQAVVDQDDLQPVDKYQRILGKVFCDGKNLNAELLNNGHATILTQYCSTSEFANEDWAIRNGC